MEILRPGALVELGAGNADKTRTILDAMRAARDEVVYVPVDVSAAFLDETAQHLRREYPDLRVEPAVADFATGVRLPRGLPRPILYAFLGSTIGNLEDSEATELLTRLRYGMAPEDRLLLGADLVKDVAVIEAAYNDAKGVTAEFNRNMLRVLNRRARRRLRFHRICALRVLQRTGRADRDAPRRARGSGRDHPGRGPVHRAGR